MSPDRPIREDELLAQRRFLWRLARGLVGDALAEDVVQEAEARALALGGRPANVRAWLVTVTRNVALNLRRAGARRERHEDAARRSGVRGAPEEPPEVLAGLELQRDVLAAVRALEEPYRAVVWLRYYEDQKPQEIAARLGLPLATVKTRLRRALEKLRGDLDERRGGREAWAAVLVPLASRAATVAGVTAGGLVVKQLVVAAAVTALALVGWRSWRGAEPARSAVPEAARPAAELVETRSPAAEIETAPRAGAARREAVEEGAASETTAAPHAPATLSVHVTHASDGSDAAGIGLVLYPENDPLDELHALTAETDGRGRARIEWIVPRVYVLHSGRETKALVELAAGEERQLDLVLPPGIDVAGRVVDGEGAPVADAEVWLEGDYPGIRGAHLVARSDGDGRFALRSVSPRQRLGAFARGYAPSFLESLQHASTEDVAVTLVLDRPGTELRGRVVDPRGAPVAGARVAVGTHGNLVAPGRAPGVEGWRPKARLLTTDAEGRFALGWLAFDERVVRSLPVHVLAAGFALTRADVAPDSPAELRVQLEAGGVIEGVVRDADGRPVEDALIEVTRAGAVVGREAPLMLPDALTDEDGAYRLAHVPSGEVRLRVKVDGHPRLGSEESRLLADEGHLRWDIVVGASRAITGRVVDPAGNGVAGRALVARSGPRSRIVETDAAGAFSLQPEEGADEWTLELVGPGGVLDRVEGVRAGAVVELVAREFTGAVTGGFTDRAGRALAGQRLLAQVTGIDDGGFAVEVWLDALGRFELTGVAPGRYRVEIRSGELALAESAVFTLAEGEVRDLGWLASAPEPR